MFKGAIFYFITAISSLYSFGQSNAQLKYNYQTCLDSLSLLLDNNVLFKKAVFLTENCYLNNEMSYTNFDNHIQQLKGIILAWQEYNPLTKYHSKDSVNLLNNYSIYKFLKDSTAFADENNKQYILLPYTYDFNDFFGEKDWSNMFVTKLLATHSGNCHSLPYLYKILADELGAACWLSLAPNHMYIKNRCKEIGWYNTELSSGNFPIDAWIMASGYLPLQAIQNGIYMDTLSKQQEIALCVLDLAKGYEHQTRNYYDGFIIKCCDLSLQYFPLNVQAMLLKGETLKRVYEKQYAAKDKASQSTYDEMEQLYVKLFDLGYREMPEKMYRQWLQSVMKEKAKYANPKVSSVMGSKTK